MNDNTDDLDDELNEAFNNILFELINTSMHNSVIRRGYTGNAFDIGMHFTSHSLNTIINDSLHNAMYRTLNGPQINDGYNNVLHQSLYDQNPNKQVISDEALRSLHPIKYKDCIDPEQNKVCLITLEEFSDTVDIIQLPCHHCFLVDPIITWLTEESCKCPVCKYSMDSVEKKKIVEVAVEPTDTYVININSVNNVSSVMSLNFDSLLQESFAAAAAVVDTDVSIELD